MYKCFVGSLPNNRSFPTFVCRLPHPWLHKGLHFDLQIKTPPKEGKSLPSTTPTPSSWAAPPLLTSPKPQLIDTYIHLRKSWRNLGILLVYCRSLKSSDTPHRSSKQSKQNSSTQAIINVKPHPNNKMHGVGVVKFTRGWELSVLPPIGEGMSIKDAQEKKRNN